MATNLPSCFSIEFLEQLLKFLVNSTLLKYVKFQRSYGFLITKELIFGFQILDLKDHFSASLEDATGALSANLKHSVFKIFLESMPSDHWKVLKKFFALLRASKNFLPLSSNFTFKTWQAWCRIPEHCL